MAETKEQFEPKIIGFLCNWCTAAAADLAGTTRAQYPPNVHPIRVMCSGTVDPMYILKALLSGADAVMVGGCHPGDCHYVSGNYKARRKIAMLKQIFKSLGLDENRIWLHGGSAPAKARSSPGSCERLRKRPASMTRPASERLERSERLG